MKFKPSILFLISTFTYLFFGYHTKEQVFDVQFHDTYYVFDNFSNFSKISLLNGIIALIYFLIERTNQPFEEKLGNWHFGLFFLSILLWHILCFLPKPSYSTIQISRLVLFETIIVCVSLLALL